LIKTSIGYRPIEEIKPGDLVLTHAGRYRPVEASLKKNFRGELWRMKFQSCLELVLTYNHPLYRASHSYVGDIAGPWTVRDWTFPGEWKKSYLCVAPLEQFALANDALTFDDFDLRSNPQTKLQRWPIDEMMAKFVGRFLADGHCRKMGIYGMELAFDRKDTSIEAFRTYLQGLGIAARIEPMKGQCNKLVFSSKLMWIALKQCYSESRMKVCPSWYRRLGQFAPLMLYGWLDGDGWRHPKGHRIGVTISKALALSMRDMAHSLGHQTSLQAVRRHRYTKQNRLQFWLTVYDAAPSKAPTHRARFTELNDVIFPLKSRIKEHYSGEVYNLQVAEDRSFVADGLVIHNCVMALALADMHRKRSRRPMAITPDVLRALDGMPRVGTGLR
jgi:hypothetical protein